MHAGGGVIFDVTLPIGSAGTNEYDITGTTSNYSSGLVAGSTQSFTMGVIETNGEARCVWNGGASSEGGININIQFSYIIV